jgi:hypothetical protein
MRISQISPNAFGLARRSAARMHITQDLCQDLWNLLNSGMLESTRFARPVFPLIEGCQNVDTRQPAG